MVYSFKIRLLFFCITYPTLHVLSVYTSRLKVSGVHVFCLWRQFFIVLNVNHLYKSVVKQWTFPLWISFVHLPITKRLWKCMAINCCQEILSFFFYLQFYTFCFFALSRTAGEGRGPYKRKMITFTWWRSRAFMGFFFPLRVKYIASHAETWTWLGFRSC